MKKLTKSDIEKLAKEVIQWAADNELGTDWSLFYNGKIYCACDGKIEEKVNPIDYSEYFPEKFIMGMAYDGRMYEAINEFEYYDLGLDDLLGKYGLYLEHCDYCHSHFCEDTDDMEIEYTVFKKPKELNLFRSGYCLGRWDNNPYDYPSELDKIMEEWNRYSQERYHKGLCVIGECVEFDYKGDHFRMHNQGVYQGDMHFAECAEHIKPMLTELGATNVYINMGRLD